MFAEERADLKRLVAEQDEWRGRCVNLIASEQVMSRAARALMGSDFTHRYAEGHPGERYYQGTDKIDEIESRLKDQLKALFRCRHSEVRPISGTNANEVVLSRYIRPGDIVMTNSTAAGGHISHQRFGSAGKFTRNIIAFPCTRDGYHIDVGGARDVIRRTRPSVVIFGRSLFLFSEPVRELRDVCAQLKVRILYDASHVLGLIAGGAFQQPLSEGAPVVTGSTHKTFPGPQRGVILSNLDDGQWGRIDRAAFPGSISNHHLDTLAPLLQATYEMRRFATEYARQVIVNARHLAASLDKLGLDLEAREFGYTESHQVAVDVSRWGGGSEVSKKLRRNDIVLNMNLLPHEPLKNHDNPAGVRIGVQEMTRFGMKEPEMEEIARLLAACIKDAASVIDEVHRLRDGFQTVQYSFDGEEGSDTTLATRENP